MLMNKKRAMVRARKKKSWVMRKKKKRIRIQAMILARGSGLLLGTRGAR